MMGKRKVLVSGIAVAVMAMFVVLAMPEWHALRGATEAKDVRGKGILYASIVDKWRSNTNPKRSIAVITGQYLQKMMAFDGTHVLRHHSS